MQGAQLWGAGSLQGQREGELGIIAATALPTPRKITDEESHRCWFFTLNRNTQIPIPLPFPAIAVGGPIDSGDTSLPSFVGHASKEKSSIEFPLMILTRDPCLPVESASPPHTLQA